MKNFIKILVLLFSFSLLISSCSSTNDSETSKLRKEIEELKKKNPGDQTDSKEDETDPDFPEGKKTKAQVSMDSGYLTLRDAPDAKTGKPIGKIPNGAEVMVGSCQKNKVYIGGKNGSWCQATYKDKNGWIFDAFLVKPGDVGVKTKNLITAKTVGDIRIGMTVAQARKAFSNAKFSRTSDGEGIALIAVKQDGKKLMTLYAGEEDNEKPIKENAKIEQIEVWSSNFKTAEGVHAKMKISDVEKILGKIKNEFTSEIESRQFVEFTKQPKYLSFRKEDTDFEAMEKDTEGKQKSYKIDPYIFSITISK